MLEEMSTTYEPLVIFSEIVKKHNLGDRVYTLTSYFQRQNGVYRGDVTASSGKNKVRRRIVIRTLSLTAARDAIARGHNNYYEKMKRLAEDGFLVSDNFFPEHIEEIIV